MGRVPVVAIGRPPKKTSPGPRWEAVAAWRRTKLVRRSQVALAERWAGEAAEGRQPHAGLDLVRPGVKEAESDGGGHGGGKSGRSDPGVWRRMVSDVA